jgi:hypothetical protein
MAENACCPRCGAVLQDPAGQVGPVDESTAGRFYFCVQCPEAWQVVSDDDPRTGTVRYRLANPDELEFDGFAPYVPWPRA